MVNLKIEDGIVIGIRVYGKLIPTKKINTEDNETMIKLSNAVDVLQELTDDEYKRKREKNEKRNQYIRDRVSREVRK